MNTIENNKLIAEFLGITDEIETGENSIILLNGIIDYHKIDNLKFHSDWNWLMTVVEKIETKKYFKKEVQFCILKYSVCIQSICKETAIVISPCIFSSWGTYGGTEKIKAVYNSCIEFIKWYNEQKK